MTTKLKMGPSPQAVIGFKRKCDRLVSLEKELDAKQAALEAQLDPIREKFEPDIEGLKAKIKVVKDEVNSFGIENAENVFAEGSELRTKTSVITGRKTAGTVTIQEGMTEKEVVESVESERALKPYLNVTTKLDKPAIKKVFTNGNKSHAERLGACGVILKPGFTVTVKSKGD